MLNGGPVELAAWLVSLAAALTAAETIRRKALVPLWRFYRWLRHEVRDEIVRRKQIDEIINRELTHNGGSSMKDHTTTNAAMLIALGQDVADLKESQETTFELLDAVVERKGTEHDEIWSALAALGIERRTHARRQEDKENQ